MRLGRFSFAFVSESDLEACTSTTQKEYLRIYIDEVVFTLSCIITVLILQLPMTNINGKPVPTFIFATQPSSFHAFLIFIMAACYTSICSIYLRERKPKVARLYNGLAVVTLAASLLVLLAAAVCAGLKSYLSLNSAMSAA